MATGVKRLEDGCETSRVVKRLWSEMYWSLMTTEHTLEDAHDGIRNH